MSSKKLPTLKEIVRHQEFDNKEVKHMLKQLDENRKEMGYTPPSAVAEAAYRSHVKGTRKQSRISSAAEAGKKLAEDIMTKKGYTSSHQITNADRQEVLKSQIARMHKTSGGRKNKTRKRKTQKKTSFMF
jgi:hypothetical protein